MWSIGEFFYLPFIRLKVFVFDLLEERKARRLFYGCKDFSEVDLHLAKAYQSISPFSLSYQFALKSNEEHLHTYGETPLTAIYPLLKRWGISHHDLFLELGCGRGRMSFFVASIFGCFVRAIDYHPIFIEKAQQIASQHPKLSISFICQDMVDADFSDVSAVYLCGTCLSDSLIESLADRMKTLSQAAKIITVSFSLLDYCPDDFILIDRATAFFSWGCADVFLQKKRTT
jgi:SAM-dependent methyltransferase